MKKTFDEVVDAIATDYAILGCRDAQRNASNRGDKLSAEELTEAFNVAHEFMTARIRRLNQSRIATAPSAEEPVKE